ncbi:MAG: rRNA maturation RNase YbeY [Deltaproteobacteria bacterium]|nr:MAG: rRNA maturation RNase YbeY [Deltaproteobacteria bacterium]
MEILINLQQEIPGVSEQKIRRKMAKVLDALDCHDKELSILVTSDDEIARLNMKYLGRRGPTNVIAFPMSPTSEKEPESPLLGDIVISVDTASRETRDTGETLLEAVGRLLIHGLLHLLGYEHEQNQQRAKEMQRQENRLIKIFKEA